MSKNKYNGKMRPSAGRNPRGKVSQKSLAIISVCAIILGIFITAQEYLDRHTLAASAAEATVTETLAEVVKAIPAYAQTMAAGSSEADALTDAADTFANGSFREKIDAYREVADILEKHSSDKAAPAKAMREAMSTAEDAAVAYNKEAQALNEKIVKFPYNIVAKLGGYAEFPIFTLN